MTGFASTKDLADKIVSFDELGAGLYGYTAEGDPNSGVVIGPESALVVDAQATPEMAKDVIARIGGDEIAVLLTGVDYQGAENAKARINHAIQNHNQTRDTDIPLSVSIGCATAHAGENLNEAFQKADTAMYEEKKARKKNNPAK